MITYFLIFGGFMLISWLISYQLKSRFKKYALIPMNYGLSGCEVAEKMLRDHGIKDVKILSVKGELSDHYVDMPTKLTTPCRSNLQHFCRYV
jgi:Zn-dependent membrane protease YugP